MQSLRYYEPKKERLSDWLPWAALIAPGVVVHKDRIFQKSIAFRGPDLSSSSKKELQLSTARLNNALKRLGTGWTFFSEAQRFQTNEYIDSQWDNPVGWIIDEERRGQHEEQGVHFDSSYYGTFVWITPSDSTKKTEHFFVEDPNRKGQDASYDANRDLHHFTRTVGDIVGIMRECFPAVEELNDDDTLTYLHSCVSTRRHKMVAPPVPMYLDALLTDEAYDPGEVAVLGDNFLMTACINDFPSEAIPGVLDSLNHMNVEYRWCTRFICLDKSDAEAELTKYRRKWYSKRKGFSTLIKEAISGEKSDLIDTDADTNASDANVALQELATDSVAYGYYTATVTVWDKNLARCEKKMESVTEAINSRGFATRLETSNSFAAWLSSLPGHVYANVRRPLINTVNLAHVFPLSAVWSGEPYDDNLGKKFDAPYPLMLCDAVGGTPFRLSLNVGDVGHTGVFGPTGSGKSTFLSMLALQWLRYPNARVVFLDKDKSSRAATMGVGGSMFIPGDPDRPVAFQPLAGIDQIGTMQWAVGWIELIMGLQHIVLKPHQRNEIAQTLKALAEAPREQRTLSGFQSLVQDSDIREGLSAYTTGPFAQIFDSDSDELTLSRWMLIEMGRLMALGEAAVVPALSYIFRTIEKGFGKGAPTLLVLDEAWVFLDHTYFRSKFREWLKTLRRLDVYVVFATQELEDALESQIASAILGAVHTKIFLPNEEANTPVTHAAYQKCGLSDAEIDTLQSARPKREYFYRSPRGRRLFEMQLGPVALCYAARSGDVEQQKMDNIEQKYPPEEWPAALLRDSGLQWAENLLGTFTDKKQRVS